MNSLVGADLASKAGYALHHGFAVPARYLGMMIGFDAARPRLLARGIDPANGDISLPVELFVALVVENIFACGDETSGVGRRNVPLGTTALMVASALQAATLAECMHNLVEAARIVRPDLYMCINRGPRTLKFSLSSRCEERLGEIELRMEFIALTLHCVFRRISGASLRPLYARASETLPGHPISLMQTFRCPLRRRGAGITFYYDRADGDRPITPFDFSSWSGETLREFYRLVEEGVPQAEGEAAHPVVSQVADLAGQGFWSQSDIARRLSTSPASLRRRLTEAGTSFRAVLAAEKRRTAARLLLTDESVETVAVRSGFRDVRAFRRASQRWFGMSPTAYRRQHHRNLD